MERRSIRATLDCEVAINEISMAAIRARQERRSRAWVEQGNAPRPIPDPPPERVVQDSALLQETLRKDPASLDAWLALQVAAVLSNLGIPRAALPMFEERQILAPVIERLPPAERDRLREAVVRGMLLEHVDEFFYSFDVTIQKVELQHVRGPGTSPRAGWRGSRPAPSRSSRRDGTIEWRRVRAVLDCEVEIRDISLAAIERRKQTWLLDQITRGRIPEYIPPMPSEPEVEDLALLQEALRGDPASLDAWVLHEVATRLAIEGIEAADQPEGEEERILGPVVERLPPAPRHRFREALAQDRFWEIADEFYLSFHETIHGVEFDHVGGGGEDWGGRR